MTSEQNEANQSVTDAGLDRRSFVIATVAVAACACCGSANNASAQASLPAAEPVDVGKLTDYAKDGVSMSFAKSKQLLVIRNEGKLYASTALCTHRQCVVELKGAVIACPCHKSAFSNQGTVLKGPAKESLVRYAISVNDGKVLVDTTKSFREKKWEDPASFIDVSKA